METMDPTPRKPPIPRTAGMTSAQLAERRNRARDLLADAGWMRRQVLAGQTPRQIAARLGVSARLVGSWLRRHQLPV